MSKADIEKVKKAESQADLLKKKAHEEAAEKIAQGKKEAKDVFDAAKKKAEELYNSAIEKAEAEAADIYQQLIDKENEVCEKIKADGRVNLSKVADFIVGKVVDTDGNS